MTEDTKKVSPDLMSIELRTRTSGVLMFKYDDQETRIKAFMMLTDILKRFPRPDISLMPEPDLRLKLKRKEGVVMVDMLTKNVTRQ